MVEAVRDACERAGYSRSVCRLNIPVALTEAVTNAIVCGNASDRNRLVHIRALVDEACVSVEVTDEGPGFDVEAVRERCRGAEWVSGEDGRGVFLMYSLMDKVETWCHQGHTVRLTLHRT